MCKYTHIIFKAEDMAHSRVFPAFPLHLEQNLNPQALPTSSPVLPSPPSTNTQAPSPAGTFFSIHVQTLLKPFWSLRKRSATKEAELSFPSKTAPTCPALASYLCYFPSSQTLPGMVYLFVLSKDKGNATLSEIKPHKLIAHYSKEEPMLAKRSS